MTTTVDAIYEHGKLLLTKPLALPENSHVRQQLCHFGLHQRRGARPLPVSHPSRRPEPDGKADLPPLPAAFRA